MTKHYFLTIIALAFISLSAVSQKRFFHPVFDSVEVSKDHQYGSNYSYDILKGELGLFKQDLFLDIYKPHADEMTNRPLIIWAHGGSFLGGTKDDADIVYFCNEFAKRGFVTASIQYRLGYELPLDSVAAVRTVYRALQDGRAAIRYLRSKADSLGIDPNRIYFGGTSAGAFIGVNMAALNLSEEVPSYVDTSAHYDLNTDLRFGLDGIEGTTNDIEASSEIHGVINFCGATKTVKWLDDNYSSNIPMISMHGTRDATVPYGTRVIKLNDLTPVPQQVPIPIVEVQGSYAMDKHADEQGYVSRFYTWYGAGHVPYISFNSNETAAKYMDTLMQFTVKYVYEDFLLMGEAEGIAENEPPCDWDNDDTLPCARNSVQELTWLEQSPIIENPINNNELKVKYNIDAEIISLSGKRIYQGPINTNAPLNLSTWNKGIYILREDNKSHKFVIN